MVKKSIVLITASILLLLFGCGDPEAQTTASDISEASQITGIVPEPRTSACAITDVSQPDGKGYYICDYNGIRRGYMLYIPEGTADSAPLLFMLHGFGGSSESFMVYTGMNSMAKEMGFAVVYPQGINAQWNYWQTDSGNDDIGFLVALAKYLQQTYGFSSSETFAAGFSNGAFMMYKLACEASDTFRAVVSVAGSMDGGLWNKKAASVSVGILQINGTKDNIVHIENSASAGTGREGEPAIGRIIDYWKSANNLGESQEVKLSDKATVYKYWSNQNDNLVWYIEIEGLGHEWPSEENSGFNANEAIFEFFSNYTE